MRHDKFVFWASLESMTLGRSSIGRIAEMPWTVFRAALLTSSISIMQQSSRKVSLSRRKRCDGVAVSFMLIVE